MNRSALVALALSLALAGAAARAQDTPKPDAPKPGDSPAPQAAPTPAGPAPNATATPAAPAPQGSPTPPPAAPTPAPTTDDSQPKPGGKSDRVADAKAPDPSKPNLGESLPAGTVPRRDLFPLQDGRTWRYELKTWLTPTANDDATGDEIEPPRNHKLDVRVVDPSKIEGHDARCLEYRLDDETAQRAFFFEESGAVLCPRRVLGSGEHLHSYDFVPAQPVFQGELGVGATWEWRGKVGPTTGKQTFKVLGEARIKSQVKEIAAFDTIVIQTFVDNDDDSKGVSTKWYSPGFGIVKELTEVKADRETSRTEAVLTKVTPLPGK